MEEIVFENFLELSQFLADKYSLTPDTDFIRNGHIIRFMLDNPKNPTPCVEKLMDFMNNSTNYSCCPMILKLLRSSIQRIMKKFNFVAKNLKRDSERVINYINNVVNIGLTANATAGSSSVTSLEALFITPKSPPTSAPYSSSMSPPTSLHQSPSVLIPSPPQSSPPHKRLRFQCTKKCITLRESNKSTIMSLQRKVVSLRRACASTKVAYETRKVNQWKKRNSVKVANLNHRIKLKENELNRLRRSNAMLVTRLDNMEEACKANFMDRISHLENEVRYLENQVSEKSEALKEVQSLKKIAVTKYSRRYATKIRKCIYVCLSHNVSVQSTSAIMLAVIKMLGDCDPGSLPSPSTIAQMAREMGVIANIQVAEALLQGSGATLTWDATTIKGEHVNQVHFATKHTVLTASIQALPGGCAADYVQHIEDSLSDVESSYAGFMGISQDEVRKQVRGSILCTLTDRASANRASVTLLEHKFQRQLVELHCHLHPLDGIAREVSQSLKKMNIDVPSALYGKDCRAANLLHSISKLRYKANGDPSGFKSCLKYHGLSCGTFVRYVGNRLHVLFHLAGTVFLHRDVLLTYLDKFCSNKTTLTSATVLDLNNHKIICHLQALGLWGKLVTGPWMALFYSEETKRSHLGMVRYLKTCRTTVKKLEEDPGLALSLKKDAFGRPLLQGDTLLSRLQDPCQLNNAYLLSTLAVIAKSTANVMDRQLDRYFKGPLAKETNDLRRATSSAPLHNIWAERALGTLDAQVRRAPNADMTFLDAKVKVKVNHTLTWLEKKSQEEQQKIITFAIHKGVDMRKQGRERMRAKEEDQLRRQEQKAQKRDMAHRNRVAKDVCNVRSLDDPLFSDLADSARQNVGMILELNPLFVGTSLEHTWSEEGKDLKYMGRVIKVCPGRSNKKPGFLIAYWLPNEMEEESVDYRINSADLIVDVILGDLTFL